MRVYKDIVSNEEIISDSFKFEFKFGEVIGMCKSQMITKGGTAVNIGAGNAFGGGEEDECVDMSEMVNNVMDAFTYQETTFDKKSYQLYLKGFMKRIKGHLEKSNPDRVEAFMAGAKEAFAWVKDNFDEFTFYMPESYDAENTIILSYYEEGAATPTFVFWMDGMKGQLV